jgi:hypothetical protein
MLHNVATNPNTPAATLRALAKDVSAWLRAAVASNPHTPAEVLDKLAKDEAASVRATVALNPNYRRADEIAAAKSLLEAFGFTVKTH